MSTPGRCDRLVGLYPTGWRERYGDELTALLEDTYGEEPMAIEPVFGNIKGNRGYRRFARRGLSAVNSEWRLICATHNLMKLWRMSPAG